MEGIIKAPVKETIELFGLSISFSPIMLYMTWLVMGVIVLMSYLATKNLQKVPNKMQGIMELIYGFLNDISVSTLGEKDGRKYLPFFMTIFIFVLVANWIALIPNVFAMIGTLFALIHKAFGGNLALSTDGFLSFSLVPNTSSWYYFLFKIPAIEEPTKFVNTDLALALLVFLAVQLYGIKNKGFFGYLGSFVNDPFPMKGPLIFFFWLNPFFYLNLVGAVANTVSHSFRLFGNIFGGAMIIVIVSTLLKYFLVPVGLFAFFGLFAGIVQAFVFAMLSVTYIAQQK